MSFRTLYVEVYLGTKIVPKLVIKFPYIIC